MNEQGVLAAARPDRDARNWAMICHLSALAGCFIPFGNILAPLLIWALKKDTHVFVDEQGKEALNFQLTITLAYIASAILIFVLVGFVLLGLLLIYSFIMIIIAAVKASDGLDWRFPYIIRFVS